MWYSKPTTLSSRKVRSTYPGTARAIIYLSLILLGIFLNWQQYFIEQYMRFALRNEQIIVSFSTTPHRIAKMQPTVQSILNQQAPIKAIYLAVPYTFKRENIEYVIPEWLQNHRQIQIIRTDDYGPATKLLGVLQQVALPSNAIIVTLDDDINYPPNAVLHLAYMAMKNPQAAIGISGARPDYDGTGMIRENSFNGLIREPKANAHVDILQGYAGIAYRRKFFGHDIFAINAAPTECINSDDLYISFYLAKQQVDRLVLAHKYIDRYKIDFQNELSLDSTALHQLNPSPAVKHRSCVAHLKKNDPQVRF